jgi:CubicO group peptidase (beta-lactamase class C family)
MHRRGFLLGTAGVALTPLIGHAQKKSLDHQEPWFDPSYARLPNAEQLSKGLAADVIASHAKPREVNGVPVTGLPHNLARFDEDVTALFKESGLVGMSLALAVNHDLMVTRGFGHLSSVDRMPALPTSMGYLGSITKPMVVMTALTLVHAGKLKLDQPVLEVLPLEPLLRDDEIRQPEIDSVTVRMLMNHTSGLFNYVEDLFDRPYYRQLGDEGKLKLVHGDISQYDLVRRGMATPFVSKPGEQCKYSGEGLQVLGRVIEKLTNQRLDKAIASKLLAPLGIKHYANMGYLSPENLSAIDAGKASKTHTFIPSPYNESRKRSESWAYSERLEGLYGNHWGHADSCGASMLSAVDLARLVGFCFKPLGKELRTEALTPRMIPDEQGNQVLSGFGLGWAVMIQNGHHQYGHGGNFGGIQASCEATFDNLQCAYVAAGDLGEKPGQIMERLKQLGKSLRRKRAQPLGWHKYGYT